MCSVEAFLPWEEIYNLDTPQAKAVKSLPPPPKQRPSSDRLVEKIRVTSGKGGGIASGGLCNIFGAPSARKDSHGGLDAKAGPLQTRSAKGQATRTILPDQGKEVGENVQAV